MDINKDKVLLKSCVKVYELAGRVIDLFNEKLYNMTEAEIDVCTRLVKQLNEQMDKSDELLQKYIKARKIVKKKNK